MKNCHFKWRPSQENIRKNGIKKSGLSIVTWIDRKVIWQKCRTNVFLLYAISNQCGNHVEIHIKKYRKRVRMTITNSAFQTVTFATSYWIITWNYMKYKCQRQWTPKISKHETWPVNHDFTVQFACVNNGLQCHILQSHGYHFKK